MIPVFLAALGNLQTHSLLNESSGQTRLLRAEDDGLAGAAPRGLLRSHDHLMASDALLLNAGKQACEHARRQNYAMAHPKSSPGGSGPPRFSAATKCCAASRDMTKMSMPPCARIFAAISGGTPTDISGSSASDAEVEEGGRRDWESATPKEETRDVTRSVTSQLAASCDARSGLS
jgi:hypothetical protein